MVVSRRNLLECLTYENTFQIDSLYKNTKDSAYINGHYYCDKAPGTAFLALPSYWLTAKCIGRLGIARGSKEHDLILEWVCTCASVGVIASVGITCLFLWLRFFVPFRFALLSAGVMAFGALTFPYATMLLSHAEVIGLLSIAVWCLQIGKPERFKMSCHSPANSKLLDYVGGCCCGMSISCEYDSALVCGGILVVVWTLNHGQAARLILGAVPSLLLIPAYNFACSGNPFTMPYLHEVVFTEMHQGFFGIHQPDVYRVFEMLFSPQRGLIYWTPYFALACVGYVSLYARRRSLFWLCYLVPLLQIVILSGYYNASAGGLIGERFLAPILVLLILPAAIGASKHPGMALFLAFCSIIAISVSTIVGVQVPLFFKHPLFQFYFVELCSGNFVNNIGSLFGLSGGYCLVPILISLLFIVALSWRNTKVVKP